VIVGVTDNRVNEAKYLLYEEWLREGRPEADSRGATGSF
jgi:hypothetical protein